jgi:hypothetical protein
MEMKPEDIIFSRENDPPIPIVNFDQTVINLTKI